MFNQIKKQIVRFFFDVESRHFERNPEEIDIIAVNSPNQSEADLWKSGNYIGNLLSDDECKITFTGYSIEDQDND
jgi:hypothetical protein